MPFQLGDGRPLLKRQSDFDWELDTCTWLVAFSSSINSVNNACFVLILSKIHGIYRLFRRIRWENIDIFLQAFSGTNLGLFLSAAARANVCRRANFRRSVFVQKSCLNSGTGGGFAVVKGSVW
ncbi:hypothetical protein Osc7112_6018 [Oscillatoria nigro-viridis PCC 7112]|uniref:Uncharacterized protein n=1 Tax=Phormidium nigroviride PCC 7112 TaxID=179408 RepID=K9VQJ5_9CYAN|nr:hypothetical protein Osc7112_6018 [Oscillatoria nigro-viridis PCC 7112]